MRTRTAAFQAASTLLLIRRVAVLHQDSFDETAKVRSDGARQADGRETAIDIEEAVAEIKKPMVPIDRQNGIDGRQLANRFVNRRGWKIAIDPLQAKLSTLRLNWKYRKFSALHATPSLRRVCI